MKQATFTKNIKIKLLLMVGLIYTLSGNCQNSDNVYFVNQYLSENEVSGLGVIPNSQNELIQYGNFQSNLNMPGFLQKVAASNQTVLINDNPNNVLFVEACSWGVDSILMIGSNLTTNNQHALYLDANLDTIWSKDFGYSNNLGSPINGGKPIELSNGNLAIVNMGPLLSDGFTYTSFDKTGQILNSKTYSYSNGYRIELTDIVEVQNEVIVTGHKYKTSTGNYEMFCARLDVNGDTLWTKSYDNSVLWGYQVPVAYEIEPLSNGDFLVVLQDKILSIPKGFLEIDGSGSIVSGGIQTIPNVRFIQDLDIDQNDGSIYVSSIEEDVNNKKFIKLLKYDNSQNLIWAKDFLSSYDEKELSDLVITSGQLVLSGTESLSSGMKRPFIMKLDTAGNILPGCNLHVNAGDDAFLGCLNTTAFLGGSPTAYGGTGVYTYSWSPSNLVSNAQDPNPSTSTAGTYYVTVSSGTCQLVDSVVVSGNPTLTADAGPDQTVPSGTPVVVGGSNTASGGLPPYYYDWKTLDNATISGNWSTSNPTVVNYGPGIAAITLIVSDSLGCLAFDTVEIYISAVCNGFSIEIGDDTILSSSSTLQLNSSITGGTSPFVYNWQPQALVNNNASAAPIATINNDTALTLEVTDANGCKQFDTINVYTSCPAIAQMVWQSTEFDFTGSFGDSVVLDLGNGSQTINLGPMNGFGLYTPTYGYGSFTACAISYKAGCSDTTCININICQAQGQISYDPNQSMFDITGTSGDSIVLVTGDGNTFDVTANLPLGNVSYSYANIGSYTACLISYSDSGCSDTSCTSFTVSNPLVFPGDANADGIADLSDLISVGIGHGVTGPVRPNASLNWVGQSCPDWSISFASSVNYKHADCNGDGIINDSDTTAIGLNLGLTHNKGENGVSVMGVPNLIFDLTGLDTVVAGDTLRVPIKLGDLTSPMNDLYGITFDVNYDTSLVKNGAFLDYSNSWLGSINTNMIEMQRNYYTASALKGALTKKDQLSVSGSGEIVALNIIMEDNLSGKKSLYKTLNLSFSNVTGYALDGSLLSINATSDSLIVGDPTPLVSSNVDVQNRISLYPNPTNGNLNLISEVEIASYNIIDVSGRIVRSDLNVLSDRVDMTLNLENGVYLIMINTVEGKTKTIRFIKE
ncbi:MAG: T9SS type A sorting domain-containing protein [Flavobacteriales bacterium]|nr:T9SS type A sorting domain-containing protein [Flavobacteriales bacterium]